MLRFFNVIFLIGIIFCSLEAQIPSDSLLFYYPLDHNAKDLSGNDFNGFISGTSPQTDRFGHPSGAMYFDGLDDYFIYSHQSNLSPIQGDLAISIWYKYEGANELHDPYVQFSNLSSFTSAETEKIGLFEGPNGITTGYYFEETGFLRNPEEYITDNNWHHMVNIYDSKNKKVSLYIDGVDQKIRQEYLNPSFETFEFMHIGGGFNNEYAHVSLDDIRVYTKTLDLEEIYDLFNEKEYIHEDQAFCVNDTELKPLNTSSNSDLLGPYKANETVRFSYTIESFRVDPQNILNGCQYLQGIIPVLGPGWEESSFKVLSSPKPIFGNAEWHWLQNNLISYNIENPALQLFEENGIQKLCATEDPLIKCPEKSVPLGVNTIMPSGWWAIQQFGLSDPNQSFGDGPLSVDSLANCGSFNQPLITGPWTVEFEVTTKSEINSGNFGPKDLYVSLYTFADGETGGYSQAGCEKDKAKTIFPVVKQAINPVDLVFFNASYENEIVQLNWATSAEINSKGFEIQRLENESEFVAIAWVDGKGNSNDINNYSLIDQEAEDGNRYYYRLKQIDFDGNFSFSNISSVFIDSKNEFIAKVFPNPVKDQVLNVIYSVQKSGDYQVKIIDPRGKEVYSEMTRFNANDNDLTLDIQNLSTGIYTIAISFSEKTSYKSFLKI